MALTQSDPSVLHAAATTAVTGDRYAVGTTLALVLQVDETSGGGTFTVLPKGRLTSEMEWQPLRCKPISSAGADSTSITAEGLYLIECFGIIEMTAEISAIAGGATLDVFARG